MGYYSAIKSKGNLAICNNIEWPRGYCANNKSNRESQILYDFTYVCNLHENTQRNKQIKQK